MYAVCMTNVSGSITKAVIPAAGLGTRFLPATKATPKEMLPVVDRPAIQYVVEEAIRAGLQDVLMITGRNKRALEDHFDRVPVLERQLAEQGKEALLKAVEESNYLGEIFTAAGAKVMIDDSYTAPFILAEFYPFCRRNGGAGSGACNFPKLCDFSSRNESRSSRTNIWKTGFKVGKKWKYSAI